MSPVVVVAVAAGGARRLVVGRALPAAIAGVGVGALVVAAAAARRARRRELATGQEPFAIILGCSDSRVPAEIVFDQGLGDLFVIRVAGNIVAPSQVGSVEFAAERFGTRLVVVLGHSSCSAVSVTLDELQRPSSDQSRNLRSIVDRVRREGDAALLSYARKFDRLKGPIEIERGELKAAAARVEPSVRRAIATAARHIRQVAERQVPRG